MVKIMFKQYKNKRKCLYFLGISIILLIIGGHYLLGFLPAVLEQKEKMNSVYSMLPQPPGYEKYATRYYRKGFHIGYEITYVTDKETNDEEKVWNFYEFIC